MASVWCDDDDDSEPRRVKRRRCRTRTNQEKKQPHAVASAFSYEPALTHSPITIDDEDAVLGEESMSCLRKKQDLSDGREKVAQEQRDAAFARYLQHQEDASGDHLHRNGLQVGRSTEQRSTFEMDGALQGARRKRSGLTGRFSLSVAKALRRRSAARSCEAEPSPCADSDVLFAQCVGHVLRLVGPQGKASPCVVVRDAFGDQGLGLARLLEKHARGGVKRLRSQARAHAKGSPTSRRHVSCPDAPRQMYDLANCVRSLAAQLVQDPALSPGSTAEQRQAAQRELRKQGAQVHPYGLMYHPAYPGLPNHVDKGGGRYMVLFNLGLSCTFHCGTTAERYYEFEFRSGDALVFNDANSHGAVHGMPRIHSGSAPENLPEWLRGVRIGLQFRQSKAKAT
eukprot:TRINITY_DN74861_c0_g1_i1.p1 TRINITY_DN74861_c0_g1~~TRINITY_DN74861_c0_g1_i1.p1  ORF type:complete len:397 (-),score=50.73 TRINITY_DN74861_c0_g1_i1:295-1485(-)